MSGPILNLPKGTKLSDVAVGAEPEAMRSAIVEREQLESAAAIARQVSTWPSRNTRAQFVDILAADGG